MKNNFKIAGVSALALMLAVPAFAQSAADTIVNPNAIDDQIDLQNFQVQQQFDRANDEYRFGSPNYRQGLSGSASLGYAGQSGNNEGQNLNIGARLTHSYGQFSQNLSFLMNFSEDNDGEASREDVFGVYDGIYNINDRFYGFVMGRVRTDGLADEVTSDEANDAGFLDPSVVPGPIADEIIANSVEQDAFIGVGPGVRIFDTPDLAWRVQAGVGQSYLKFGDGRSESEVGYVASSRLYWKINDSVFVTNDTDILDSDEALRANNDLGLNFRITESFSTRVSYLSDYNEARTGSQKRTNNTLGVSLVYGF